MTQAPTRQDGLRLRAVAAALGGALLLLGGCTRGAVEEAVTRPADAAGNAGGLFGQPWGGQRPEALAESVTVARLMTGAEPSGRLQAEAGDVWPGPLPPRATLANPDAALRGIPDFDSAARRDPMAEPAQAPRRSGPPRGLPPAQQIPPALLEDPSLRRPGAPVGTAPALPPLPPRADGQVIPLPGGGAAVTTGGTPTMQGFTSPGGSGTAIRNPGGTTTLIGPGGVQTVPTPSR